MRIKYGSNKTKQNYYSSRMQINNQGLGKHSFGSKSNMKNSRNGSTSSHGGSY